MTLERNKLVAKLQEGKLGRVSFQSRVAELEGVSKNECRTGESLHKPLLWISLGRSDLIKRGFQFSWAIRHLCFANFPEPEIMLFFRHLPLEPREERKFRLVLWII